MSDLNSQVRRWGAVLSMAGGLLALGIHAPVRASEAATAAPSRSATQTLEIGPFAFSPATVTLAPGTTVTWVNHDEETHTVTSATGAFTSAGLDHDETFTHTFTTPGTYSYFCALHPHMRATVIVQ
jgi:plastocyanin